MKKLYTKNDYQNMPWKNGLGQTMELFKSHLSKKSTPLDYDFRLSIATLDAPTPFSFFPDYKRIIMLQQGNGFRLHKPDSLTNKVIVIDNLQAQHTFLGTETIHAEIIDGPCLDFNIFWNPSAMDVIVSTKETLNNCDQLFIFNRETFELTHLDQEELSLQYDFSFSEYKNLITIGIKFL
jgi:environmental stress-induced protein Ves